jgi:hypothetical protein
MTLGFIHGVLSRLVCFFKNRYSTKPWERPPEWIRLFEMPFVLVYGSADRPVDLSKTKSTSKLSHGEDRGVLCTKRIPKGSNVDLCTGSSTFLKIPQWTPYGVDSGSFVDPIPVLPCDGILWRPCWFAKKITCRIHIWGGPPECFRLLEMIGLYDVWLRAGLFSPPKIWSSTSMERVVGASWIKQDVVAWECLAVCLLSSQFSTENGMASTGNFCRPNELYEREHGLLRWSFCFSKESY